MNFSRKMWFALALVIFFGVACSASQGDQDDESVGNQQLDEDFLPPSVDDLDEDDPLTEAIRYGEELINETSTVLSDHVGNKLSCQSCHADGGTSGTLSLVGVATQYPEFRTREAVAFTLEDRINGCMIRSMNGEKLDYDSNEMRSLVSYLTYISEGVAIKGERPWITQTDVDELPEPDIVNGEELFVKKNCSSCHGSDGSGTGPSSGPALWGDDSFNDGAGMGRLKKATGFIQKDMPLGDEGTLSDQEAADLAAYILSQHRPEFEWHEEDFPEGSRPTDIITKERRDQIQAGEFDWTEIEGVIPRD